MHSTHGLLGLVVSTIFAAIVLVAYLVLEIIDRLTESPAMRRRVNAGSDKFIAERGTIWQAATRAASQFIGRFGSRRFWDSDS
jgi:hypothetical protein